MNKRDAAAYLGISPRALEYHVTQGNICRRMVKGQTGDVADFDEGELRELKARLDAKRAPRPAVTRDESPETEPRSLARLADVQHLAEPLTLAAERNRALLGPTNGRATPAVSLADKLLLTLDEAAQLSGLSRGHLREAIGAGKLKGRIIGRGFKIKRPDLEAYVKRL